MIERLLEAQPELGLSVSATTRAPRPGEQDGVHYHFLDDAEFDRRIAAGDFLEHARYAANRYGTLRSEVEPRLEQGGSVVLEIEVQGARQVREAMPEAVTVFIAPPSAADPAPAPRGARHRSAGRDRAPPAGSRARALGARGEFAHEVVNDDVDAASERLLSLVRGQLR